MVNVRKLRKLQKWILAEPRRFHMAFWAVGGKHHLVAKQNPPCGTVACLAGNACLMEGLALTPMAEDKSDLELAEHDCISDKAMEILGLDELQQKALFHVDNWPMNFAEEYNSADDCIEGADITARRIEHFIKTKGAE